MKNYELISYLSKQPAGANVVIHASCFDENVRGDTLGETTTILDERYIDVDEKSETITISTDSIDIDILSFGLTKSEPTE